MTPDFVLRLGYAAGKVLSQKTDHPAVLIGKDTRISGYMLESALEAGFSAAGIDVHMCGPMPTPAVAYLTRALRLTAGVVISASHNPYQDNGLKVFGPDGFKLPDEQEEALERLMLGDELDRRRPSGMHIGRAERIETAWGRYVQFIKGAFPSDLKLDGLKIVVDAAHGAAYQTAPHVFSELGADVVAIGVKPNGKNINHERGAVHPEYCAKEVMRAKAHVGFALDGDADRVIVIDEHGNQVDGDVVMALCATRMIASGKLRKNTLVATVMSNLGLERAVEAAGGKILRTAVGDRYVVETMRGEGYNFGGEQSGHMIFLDHASTGDGLVAALQLLSIVLREQRPLSELASSAMARVPQVLVNAKLSQRRPLEEMPRTLASIRTAEEALGKSGRVVVRWSGTEPKLRVMIEGEDERRIDDLARAIIETAIAELACLSAPAGR
jgi:phosphoglucosamine mutase